MKSLILLVMAFTGLVTQAAPPRLCLESFTIEDVALTPALMDVDDHEFDPVNDRIVFFGAQGPQSRKHVVVATMDQQDGSLLPKSVRQLDSDATISGTCAGLPFGNGPEWSFGFERGWEILYHKQTAQGVPVLARLTEQAPGQWTPSLVPNSEYRSCVLPSLSPAPYPLLAYSVKEPGQMPQGLWRIDSNDGTESPIPDVAYGSITGGSPLRHIPNRYGQVVVAIEDEYGQSQMARLDLFSGRLQQITSYPPGLGIELNSVNAMEAPNYGDNVLVFYSVVNSHHIDVYAVQGWDQPQLVATLRPPVGSSPNGYVLDEENIVVDGEPFVIISMSSKPENLAPDRTSEIWVAAAFAQNPCHFRRVTASSSAARQDLDSLTVESGTYVYFRELTPSGNRVLRKARTGL